MSVTPGALRAPSLLDELRWLKRVTEDDDTDVYGRTIDCIEKLEAENAELIHDLKRCMARESAALNRNGLAEEQE